MSDLISNLQRLGDADHDDLSVAHDALAEIVRLRILTVEQHDEIERLRQWELVGREWIDKTDWMQSRDAPVRWLGKHRADAMREEIERLTAELETERMRLAACGVVALANTEQSAAKEREMLPEYRSASLADVERAVDREMQLRAERDELRDVLLRNGFVPCDIPACNCGSWHHRYGLPERMQEIKDALAEAGHELSNANGHLPINALKALVAERDKLRRQLAEAEQDARRYRWLRNEANTARKCDPMVCIYPLDEQDLIDGDRLDVAIDAAMDLTRPAEE